MKKHSLLSISLSFIVVILSGCSTSVEITKRKHRSGFHVSIDRKENNRKQVPDEETQDVNPIEPVESMDPVITASAELPEATVIPVFLAPLAKKLDVSAVRKGRNVEVTIGRNNTDSQIAGRPDITTKAVVQTKKQKRKAMASDAGRSILGGILLIMGIGGFALALFFFLDEEIEAGLVATMLSAVLLLIGINKLKKPKSSIKFQMPFPENKDSEGSDG